MNVSVSKPSSAQDNEITADLICEAQAAFQVGKTNTPAVRALIRFWFDLLQTSAIGQALVETLWLTANKIIFLSDIVGGGQHLQATTDGTRIFFNARIFNEDVALLGNPATVGLPAWAKYASQQNLMAWWAAAIGHEALHMAIGDAGILWGHRVIGAWQALGDQGQTTPAYRVHGFILNELVYAGDPANYQSGSPLTTAAVAGGWGYSQVMAAPSAVWRDVQRARFRMPVSLVKKVLHIPEQNVNAG